MKSGAHRLFGRLMTWVAIASWATLAVAQEPTPAQRGIAWLQARVLADGSVAGESSSVATTAQVRAEVLHALARHASAPAPLVAVVAAPGEENTEYIARRALALKSAGQSVEGLGGALLATQGSDGGWGLVESYGSDALDTALAWQAIVASGRSNATSNAGAIAFLNASRLPSGAWGANTTASAYVTAMVLMASEASQDPAADALASAAHGALLALKSGGHFGNVIENSVAFLALFDPTAATSDVAPILDAIRAAQDADGSWAQDPFITALAVRALATWDASGSGVRGRIVHATTGAPIVGATISLATTPPSTVTTDTNGAFLIGGVRPGTYSISISATGFGTFSAPVGLVTGQILDLGNIPLAPDAATGATVRGVVTRADSAAAIADALVTVTQGAQVFTAFTNATGNYRFDGLQPGDANLRFERTGFRIVTSYRALAAGRVYDESPRLYASTVAGAQIDAIVIDADTGSPISGAAVTLNAPATGTVTTGASGRFGFVNLAAGAQTFSVVAPGYFTLDATATLAAGQTTYGTLAMPPTVPGTAIRTLSGRVVDNLTRAPLAGVTVGTIVAGISAETTTDAEGRFTVAGYRSGILQIYLSKPGYEQSSYLYGPENPPPTNLGDFFMMPETIGSPLADLGVGNLDRSAVIEAANGVLSGSLAIVVNNVGRSSVNGAFRVTAFFDANRNGAFDAGTDPVLGEAMFAGASNPLTAGGTVSGTIAISGTAPFRDAPIHVWVDSGLAVIEANENNNVSSTAEYCRLCPTSTAIVPPGSGGFVMEPEFAGSYSPINLGPLPSGVVSSYGFMVPKKGDMCTILVGSNAAASSASMVAVKVVRDAAGHIIGFDRATRTASARGLGWGASYLGDSDLLLVSAWVGISSINGLYAYKPTDTAPGKVISYFPSGLSAITSARVVPSGQPGAGKLKSVVWPFGEWYSGTLSPDPDGYVSLTSFSRVTTSLLQGRPHDFAYVPQGSPGFSRSGIVVGEWDAGNLATYEVDANGDPITATRRVMLRGFTDIAGSMFDPLTGDYIVTRYGGNGSNQRVLAVRGFGSPAALSDLTVSRALASIDTSGRVTAVTARIGNAGPGAAAASRVGVYAIRNGTRAELLAELALAPLASNEHRDVTIVVPSPVAVPGVMVVTDIGETLLECSRTNDSAVVSIQALVGTIVASSNLAAYAPGGIADITTTVTNPGVVVTGYSVGLTIVDAAGNPIADLGRRPIDALAGGSSTTLNWSWTVPAVLAGSYRLRASLFNLANSPLGEAFQAFEILAVPAAPIATVVVATDKAAYGPFDIVAISTRVTNAQSNAILQGLRVTTRVLASDGSVFSSAEQSIASLAALSATDLAFNVPLAGAAAGGYVVETTVRDGANAVLEQQITRFVVASTGDTGNEVSGTLALSAPEVTQGASITLTGSATNSGNADLATLAMSLTVLDPATGAVLQTWSQVVPAPRLQAVPFVTTWSVPATVPAGTYAAVLSITVNGASRTLAQSTFAVRQPPILVTGTVSTDKAVYDALETASITGRVTNDPAGRALSNLTLAVRILAPGGAVVANLEQPIATLASGAIAERGYTFPVGLNAPGTYTVEQLLKDAAAVVLDTRQATFAVRSTAQSGVGVSGNLAAAPADLVVGQSSVITGVLTNAGNEDVAAVAVRLVVRDAASAIVQQFPSTVTLARAQPTTVTATWNVAAGLAPGSYTAEILATIGGIERSYATVTIVVRDIPIALTGSVGTDKATYDALESATITGQVGSAAGSRALTGLRIRHRVESSAGAVVATFDSTPFDLPAGGSATRTATWSVGTTAPGTYTVVQLVLDSAGATLDTRQVSTTVRSSAESGVGVTGTVSATPASIAAGSPTTLSGTVANAGNADLANVPVRIAVRDAANALTQEFTSTLTVTRVAPAVYSTTWTTPVSLAPGSYSVTFLATLGTQERLLATTALTIQPAAAGATLALRTVPRKALLVLVSCATAAADAVGNGSPDKPACVSSRRAAIDQVLTDMGIPHVVTTNADEFRRLLRCGDYDRFWIAGGAEKMRGTLAEEVREAVLGGDALIVDGYHDVRSRIFDEVTGVTANTKLAGVTNGVTLSGALGNGALTVPGSFAVAAPAGGVAVQGTFSNGGPAVTTSLYGQGRAAFFAFDLAGALAAAPTDTALRALLQATLGEVRPTAASGSLLAGATAAVELDAVNGATPASYRIEVTLPAGTTASGFLPTGATQAGSVVTWEAALAANETRTFALAWKLPATAGTSTLGVKLFRVEGATATEVDTDSLALATETGDGTRAALVADLNALTLTGAAATARTAAVQKIGSGWTKATQNNADGAIVDYLAADTELAKIAAPPTVPFEIRVSRLIQEAGGRACTTTLACAAPAWSPSTYSVLVFGSASMSNGQAAGPVGIGGALSMSSYAVANTLSGDAARLAVAGSLSFSSGSVGINGTGTIRVGGAASVGQSVNRRELLTGVSTEDFVGLKTWYQQLAGNLAQLPATAAAHDGFGKYTLTGTNPGLNVFTITGAALDSGHSLHFAVPDTASVVLNVTGGTAAFTNGQSYWNGVAMQNHPRASRILYNFPTAGAVSASGWSPQGTILAPNAAVTLANGNTNGAIVANSLTTSSAALACPAFEGTLPANVMPAP